MNENYSNRLIQRIKNREAVIGIVGLGYVGLPLSLRFAEMGFSVIGFDNDAVKVDTLLSGRSYIGHIPADKIQEALGASFRATKSLSETSHCDAIILCLPTPLNRHREPDLSFVVETLEALLPHLRRGQLVCLESTTWPGTTEEIVLPRLEEADFEIGQDFFLAYSPEREDPGNKVFKTHSIPKIVGGITDQCKEVAAALYSGVIEKVVTVSSTKAAEMTKLLENIHRAVNIGLVNELKIVCDKMGINIHEVIRAAATKPFGFTPYYPGPGLGGHCIPIDPFYLTWKAREYGLNTRFIELSGEVNRNMPQWVTEKVFEALNDHNKSIKGSRILIVGIAYKKNVDDARESPSVAIIKLLLARGALLNYTDPHVPEFPKYLEEHSDLKSRTLSPEFIAEQDCVVIATDHDEIDYDLVLNHAALIVDTRGRYLESRPNVVRA